MFYGAQKSLPSATWRDDCHGTCETLRSAERQGPTDSEPVELANSTTPLILYRLQKESIAFGLDEGVREDDFKMVRGRITDLPELQPCFWAHAIQQICSNPSGVCVPRS